LAGLIATYRIRTYRTCTELILVLESSHRVASQASLLTKPAHPTLGHWRILLPLYPLRVAHRETPRHKGQGHPSSSQSYEGNDTDEGSSYAFSPDDNPNNGSDFDVIRALSATAPVSLVMADHRICPHLMWSATALPSLSYVRVQHAISPRRDSHPTNVLPVKDARPRQHASSSS
jgi:hypothetical protein